MSDKPELPGKWDDDPDVQLMLRVRDDDNLAFEQICIRYSPKLLQFLRNQVGGNGSAEDLVQDVLLRVYRARKSYQATARFSTWIFHIATNVASNANRDQNRRREYTLGVNQSNQSDILSLDQLAIASTGSIPLRKLANMERDEMVRLAVAALPDRQRTALLLNKFQGLSYQEIADVMNLNSKAVKSLLSRARVGLRVLLTPYFRDNQNESGGSSSDNLPE